MLEQTNFDYIDAALSTLVTSSICQCIRSCSDLMVLSVFERHARTKIDVMCRDGPVVDVSLFLPSTCVNLYESSESHKDPGAEGRSEKSNRIEIRPGNINITTLSHPKRSSAYDPLTDGNCPTKKITDALSTIKKE